MDIPAPLLTVDGEVDNPLALGWEEIIGLPSVERAVRVDCYGGLTNSHRVRGLPLLHLLELARVRDTASSAVFYCADGYWETASLLELLQQDSFLAYPVDGGRGDLPDYLPRLAIPGRYGYKWAKWVQRVQLIAGEPGRSESREPSGEKAHPDPQDEASVVSARTFPTPPSCCLLYIWARKRLWRPAHAP